MKVLFVTSRVPYPALKGDQVRAFQQIQMMSKHNELHLLCLDVDNVEEDSYVKLNHYCQSIQVLKRRKNSAYFSMACALFSNTPFQLAYFYSAALQKKFDEAINRIQPDIVLMQLARTVPYIKNNNKFPICIDLQDAFSKGLKQRYKLSSFPFSLLLKLEYNRLLRYEQRIINTYDSLLLISEQDKQYFRDIPSFQKIQILPNAVDTDVFSTSHQKRKDIDLCFTGNMDYAPNIETALFLIREVLPLVQQTLPDINVYIVGSKPHSSISAYRTGNVVVTGWVEDMVPYYQRSKVFCAPMRSGIGLQNKLLEAMACEVPCITSSLCNAALMAEHNTNILIADTAIEVASSIVALLQDAKKSSSLAKQAREFVCQQFSMKKVESALQDILVKSMNTK